MYMSSGVCIRLPWFVGLLRLFIQIIWPHLQKNIETGFPCCRVEPRIDQSGKQTQNKARMYLYRASIRRLKNKKDDRRITKK